MGSKKETCCRIKRSKLLNSRTNCLHTRIQRSDKFSKGWNRSVTCDKCEFKTKSINGLIMHLNAEDHVTKRINITCKDFDFVCEKRFDF